jgi:hypothetical protein
MHGGGSIVRQVAAITLLDVAELLVACTVMVGPERALRAAIDGVGTDAVAGALPYCSDRR